ncbi:MAG: hypothetical protein JSR58_07770 [Verrucomicrobia bacterium]|nr:hypothetical protein [Verrucomicrobiota bacterium]
MFKRALKRLTAVREKSKKTPAKTEKAPSGKLLSAAGWKRLMMKKYRKSS